MGNTHRLSVESQGKCHRKHTADRESEVRVKWCGKSAPLIWRQVGPGKPHRVQAQAVPGESRSWSANAFEPRLEAEDG